MTEPRTAASTRARAAQIAGPRRVRKTLPAPPLVPDSSSELPTLENVRALPALDYDETTQKLVVALDVPDPAVAIEETRPERVRHGRGVRLFVVGVALGALIVSLGRGRDANDSVRDARARIASALRSIAHPQPPSAGPLKP